MLHRFIFNEAPRVRQFLLTNPRVISRTHNIHELLFLSQHPELRAIDATTNLRAILMFIKSTPYYVPSSQNHWHFFNSVGIHCLHVIPKEPSSNHDFIDFDRFVKSMKFPQ